jgi:predicted DNA-binding transcriptional regulator AlpA
MDKLALRPAEFAEAIGISRSKAYEVLGRHPELTIRIGSSVRVPVDKLKAWIQAQTTGSSSSDVA